MLLNWREYVDSLPTEPTMLTLPMDWPRPPIESRYIGQKDRTAILAKGACEYCGSESGPFHIDHVKPFSRGGSNHRANLQLACRDCNPRTSNKPLSKRRRDHSRWMVRKGLSPSDWKSVGQGTSVLGRVDLGVH